MLVVGSETKKQFIAFYYLGKMFNIKDNFDRLSLHDASIIKHTINGVFVNIDFDWCFLENYIENGIEEKIVTGKMTMEIDGYKNEKIRLDYSGSTDYKDKKAEFVNLTDELLKNWYIIVNNSINNNDKEFIISGLYENNTIMCWIDWSFNYEKLSINWDSFITYKEWLKKES